MTNAQIERRIKAVESKLLAIARRFARGNEEYAADLLQEARIKLIRVIEGEPNCGDALLVVSARNRMGDIVRTATGGGKRLVDLPEDGPSIDDLASVSPVDLALNEKEAKALAVLRGVFPKWYAAVVAMGNHDAAQEAADSLEISVPAFKSRLYRGRAELARLIDESKVDWAKFSGPEYNQNIGPRDGNFKGDKWSRKFDCCQQCGTDERKHIARGLCTRCQDAYRYAINAEDERKKRKAKRMADPVEKANAAYAQQQRWKARNRKRALQKQAEAYYKIRHELIKWPEGIRVWTFYAGYWCEGVIVSRPSKSAALVRLKGGTELVVGFKGGKIKKDRPQELAA